MKMEHTLHSDKQESGTMDLLGFMIKLSHYCFIVPKKTMVDSSWKYKLFRLTQMILVLLFPPTLFTKMIAMNHFWGQMEVITYILVTGLPMYIGFHGGAYFFKNCKEIRNIVDQMETNSVFTHPLVHSKDHLKQILIDTKRKCINITLLVTVSECITLFGFIMKPFIVSHLLDKEGKTDEEIVDEIWKNIIFTMWLPIDPRDPLTYYILYTFQVVIALAYFCFTGPIVALIFVLARYASAQFAVVSAALKDVDVLFNFPKPHLTIDTKLKNQFEMKQELQRASLIMEVSESILVNEDVNTNEMYSYVRECVRLHQSAIRFAKEVNDVFSPIFFLYLSVHTAILVVVVFQIAVDSSTGSRVLFGCLASVILMHCFGFCWHGQELIDQSLAVERAAYNILWYNHPRSVKELFLLIILRSQKEVELKGLGYINLSINTFSLILNSVYQWLTVLLNMHDE
ncbi:Odorant receptor 61 [Blattella germanica]|nr:Odorant receptor 61 [Blattella germanica]